MTHLIDKDALALEIERRRDAALMRQQNLESIGQESVINEIVANELNEVISFINTLEVKEVDLEKEVDDWYNTKASKEFENVLYSDIEKYAKHFFELGLSVSNSTKVTTLDIDDVLKENNVNPDSKEAKIIKESYFMAIEKLAQKGE